MRRRITRFALSLAVVVLAAGLFPAKARAAYCGTYTNSRVMYEDGYGGYCGNSGSTCGECTAFWGGGYTVCVSDATGAGICTDYQY